jgi:hypothetical protein
MSFLVKEYNVPFLGKIELIEASSYDKSLNGSYYAKNDNMGVFCENCKSAEELIKKVGLKIKECIKYKIDESQDKIINEKKNQKDLELILKKTNIKNGGLQKRDDWLKQYQTDNPLQLEYQDAERERQKGDKK